MTTPLDRRAFLAGIGVLGALGATSLATPQPASAAPISSSALLDIVRKLLGEISKDTYKGLAVFVAPGSDPYSRSQGSERTNKGALEAKVPDFLIESLDNYVPLPDQLGNPLSSALSGGLADIPIKLPLGINLPVVQQLLLKDLEDAVKYLLSNDETLPLSLLIASLLNTQAVRVDPSSAVGPFLSPFSRLSIQKKSEVFELLETADPQLVALVDRNLPDPLKSTVSGLLQFVAGAVLEFAAFGAFNEWHTFDPETKFVTSTPVGWEYSGYDAGSMEGWDEFKGYYQNRTKAEAH